MRAAIAVLLLLIPQDDTEAKLKEFADVMKSGKGETEKLRAIETVAATRSLKAVTKLAQIVAAPYPEALRVAAADAVGKIGDVRGSAPLLSYLSTLGNLLQSDVPSKREEEKVAEAAVRAIGTLRDRSGVRQLTGMLISANIPLMAEVVRTLGKIRDPGCMEGLLKLHYAANSPEAGGVTNPRKPLAPDTLAALRRITGQKLTSPDEWNKWYKSVGGRVVVPPEESLGGLPPEVRQFAIFGGRGEIAMLRRFDLVLLHPENYSHEEIGNLFRPIALTGDPRAAIEKGFAGFVCDAARSAELRKKFPRALIIARGDPKGGAPGANAILVNDLDLKNPDESALEALRELHSKSEAVTLAVFVSDQKDDVQAAASLAKNHPFLLAYVSHDKDHTSITAP